MRGMFASVLFSAGLAGAAAAQPVPLPETTTWNCWYDGATVAYCVLAVPVLPSETVAPLDRYYPSLVRAIRNDPTSIDGPVGVPLNGIPYDLPSMQRLVTLVMCGRKPRCTVNIEGNNLPRPVVAENRRPRR